MTEVELKKLKRVELLEMLLEASKENKALRQQFTDLTRQLEERATILSTADSIAEATLRLNGVFQAAQAAADQYLSSIKSLKGVIQKDTPSTDTDEETKAPSESDEAVGT